MESPDSNAAHGSGVLSEGLDILTGVSADFATINDDVDECVGVLQQLLQVGAYACTVPLGDPRLGVDGLHLAASTETI